MNPIADALPTALDPATWDWGGKIFIPAIFALLTGIGRYVFLTATRVPSKKITDLLELKAQVPEADHRYLEPAYRAALRTYLRRSLKAQMPLSYKISSVLIYTVSAALILEVLIGLSEFLIKGTGNYTTWIMVAVIAVELGIIRDWAWQLGTHRSARNRELWQEAGLRRWGSRPKMGSVSAGFKLWSFLTLALFLVPFVILLIAITHDKTWLDVVVLLLVSVMAGCSIYFTILWLYDISFKPGSKRHVYARYRATLGTVGAVSIPILLFVAANWIPSFF